MRTGTVCAELGNLGLLRVLNLGNNRLAGTLPASWGAQMSALNHLRLGYNNYQASPALRQQTRFGLVSRQGPRFWTVTLQSSFRVFSPSGMLKKKTPGRCCPLVPLALRGRAGRSCPGRTYSPVTDKVGRGDKRALAPADLRKVPPMPITHLHRRASGTVTRTKLRAERAALMPFPCVAIVLQPVRLAATPTAWKQNQVPSQVYIRRTSLSIRGGSRPGCCESPRLGYFVLIHQHDETETPLLARRKQKARAALFLFD